MLSSFSFNDFFSEYNLKKIDNKELFLLALLSFRNLNTTQIHKLSFLTFAEEKIIIPFEFIKMPHGPFSEELRDLLEEFRRKGLIEKSEESHLNYTENIWSLSEGGQKLMLSNKFGIDEIKAKLKKIVEEYDVNAKSLERYCYSNYLLKSEKESLKEWESKIKTSIDNLLIILERRAREMESIEDIDEPSRVAVLACFDYIDKLLRELLSNQNADQVIKGVLISKSESYINLWGEILCLVNDGENLIEIRNLLKDSKELFNFINISAERYGVFESVF